MIVKATYIRLELNFENLLHLSNYTSPYLFTTKKYPKPIKEHETRPQGEEEIRTSPGGVAGSMYLARNTIPRMKFSVVIKHPRNVRGIGALNCQYDSSRVNLKPRFIDAVRIDRLNQRGSKETLSTMKLLTI